MIATRSKQESAVTQPQLVHFIGTEDVGFGDGKKPIPLSVCAGIRQTSVSAVRLGNETLVPEPATGDLVFAVTHAAIVADDVLVITNGCDV